MPIITSIITAGTALAASAGAALSAGVSALGGFLAVGRIILGIAAIGYSFAQQSMARQKQKKQERLKALNGTAAGEAIQQSISAPIMPQRVIYGKATVGIATFFFEDIPPYRVVGGALAAHEVDGFEWIKINGTICVLDAAGWVTNAPFTRPDGRQLLRISLRKGTADQAVDPIIIQRAPWVGTTFRQRETATIVVEANYGNSDAEHQEVWAGALEIIVRVRGKKLYDPRDPTQRFDVKSSWRWSDSPTLALTDFMTWDDKFGVKLKPDRVNWPLVAESANIDNQMVQRKDGTFERRYTINGAIDTDVSAEDAMTSMITCNRGRIVDRRGKVAPIAGRYTDPVMTITQAHLTGGFDYRASLPRRESVNVLRTRFVDPEREYQIQDGPVLESLERQIADGGVYEDTLEFGLVEDSSRVQRLGKAAFEDAYLGRLLRAPLSLACFRVEPGDNVRVEFPDAPWVNGIYGVESSELNEDLSGVSLTLVETGPQIYEFDPAVDEQPFFFQTITR